MSNPSYGSSGEARQALADILRDYGPAALDRPELLNQLLPDLLAGSPREASLLQAAASVGVSGLLTSRIAQGIPAEAAVRDISVVLMERHALEPHASLWVVSEYAGVLGYPVNLTVADTGPAFGATPVPPVTPAPPATPPGPGVTPVAESSPTIADGPGGISNPAPYGQQPQFGDPAQPTAQFGQQQPYGQPGPTAQFGQPAAQYGQGQASVPPYGQPSAPPYGQAPYSAAPAYGPYPAGIQAPKKSKTPLILAIVAVVLLVLCGGGIAIALAANKDKTPTAGPTTHAPHTATAPPSTQQASPTSDPSTPPPTTTTTTTGEVLDNLMPIDLDVTTDCSPADTFKGAVGITTSYACTEPSSSTVPGAHVFAYQTDTASSFNTSWAAYNKYLNFNGTGKSLQHKCPASVNDDGATTWHFTGGSNAGKTAGKLECYQASDDGYVYLWSDIANHSFFLIHGTKKQSTSKIDSWWKNSS